MCVPGVRWPIESIRRIVIKFNYPAEKLSIARRALMLPHPNGEEESIASAFFECQSGFIDLNNEDLDDNSQEWVSQIRGFMDTSEIQASSSKWAIKASQLTVDERLELSRAVDELAHWFRRRLEEEYQGQGV